MDVEERTDIEALHEWTVDAFTAMMLEAGMEPTFRVFVSSSPVDFIVHYTNISAHSLLALVIDDVYRIPLEHCENGSKLESLVGTRFRLDAVLVSPSDRFRITFKANSKASINTSSVSTFPSTLILFSITIFVFENSIFDLARPRE